MQSLGTASLAIPLLVSLGGCYGAQLDPSLSGVFACDEGEQPCPEGQACVNGRCASTEVLPTVSILNPEEGKALTTLATEVGPLGPDIAPIDVVLSFQGNNLELGPAGSGDHVFGQGHLAVFVDGEEEAVIDSGSITDLNQLTISVGPRPGPHRIAVQARRNDGIDYDNPEALATRLIWLENVATAGTRPQVAIRYPWPGQAFDLQDQSLEVQVMTLNFDLQNSVDGGGQTERTGHAHVYYAISFPECSRDEVCDQSYLGVAGTPVDGEAFSRAPLQLPTSGEQSTTLTTVLRNIDHSIYRFPFGCVEDSPLCVLTFDEIEIIRAGG